VEFDSAAAPYTEAPDTVKDVNQRFRWSFGTPAVPVEAPRRPVQPQAPGAGLHRLPQMWLFQIILHRRRPLVDLAIFSSLAGRSTPRLSSGGMVARRQPPLPFYWRAFIFLDLSAGALGMAWSARRPGATWSGCRAALRLPPADVLCGGQVGGHRHRGYRVGWGKLERRATAVMGKAPDPYSLIFSVCICPGKRIRP